MGDFDSYDYSINDRLPEWWKGFGALEPINNYTQKLITTILQALLTSTGVAQPLNCWLGIPEEYTWYHHYKATDDYLQDEGVVPETDNAVTTLFVNNKMHAKMPNTKRPCNARIQLKLLGTELEKDSNGNVKDKTELLDSGKENLEWLKIRNADQQITFYNIPASSTIEILTEDNEIMVDGVTDPTLIEGSINKIRPTIKNANYQEIDTSNNDKNDSEEITFTPTFPLPNQNEITLKDENKRIGIIELEEKDYLEVVITNLNQQINIDHIQINKEDNKQYFFNILLNKNNFFNETNLPKKGDTIKITFYNGKNTLHHSEYFTVKETPSNEEGITLVKQPKKLKNIDIEDENKKTELIIESSKTVKFDLQVYLYKPTYTTEQHIRVASVSAFPIEYIRVFGYFCHPFNNQVGYRLLYEKEYTYESRTTFDRITLQRDCERFYIEVKFHGIGVPLYKGFPQSFSESNYAFLPNPNLDKWGKIYNLPRRKYKPDITEDEEPFTFPKYYKYPIEQDYWYEERMVNEYKFENDAVNALFIRDDDFNRVGFLECIYPFTNDIWIYTETINPNDTILYKVQNEERDTIPLCSAIEEKNTNGKEWESPDRLTKKAIYTKLNPQRKEVFALGDYSYQTKKLKLSFCLSEFDNATPKDITIKGIELKFKTNLSVQGETIKLQDDSKFLLPYPKPNFKNRNETKKEYKKQHPMATDEEVELYIQRTYNEKNNYFVEEIDIPRDDIKWVQQKGYYTIGGEKNLFLEKKITREQLFKGNDGKVEFKIGFINENEFLESDLYIEDALLSIYYEIIPNDYSIDVKFNTKKIDLRSQNKSINMQINIKNTGDIEVHDKELFIIVPPEIMIGGEGYDSYKFNLEVNEVCDPINVTLKPSQLQKTGWYDILVICEDKVIKNEILIKGSAV